MKVKILYIMLLVFIFVPVNCFCQDKPLIIQPSAKEIFLLWERSDSNQSFMVFRKESESEYKLLNKEPLNVLTHRYDITTILGDKLERTIKLFNVRYPEQIYEKLDENKMANILGTMIMPELAVIRGIGYVDRDIKAGISYEYKVNLITTRGNVPFTRAVKVVAENHFPKKPKHFTVTGQNNEIHLNWDIPESPNAGYDIFRAGSLNGRYEQINRKRILIIEAKNSKNKNPCFIDKEVMPGRTYWYKVAGRDALGNLGIYSDTRSAKAIDKTPPFEPNLKKIKLSRQKIVLLEWKHKYTKDVNEFRIYRSRNIREYGNLVKTKIPNTYNSFKDVPETPGFYWYRISAVDQNGNEAYSNAEGVYINK